MPNSHTVPAARPSTAAALGPGGPGDPGTAPTTATHSALLAQALGPWGPDGPTGWGVGPARHAAAGLEASGRAGRYARAPTPGEG